MRFLATFIWSFLLVSLLNYVAGAIANVPFNFEAGIYVSLIVSVLIIALGEAIPTEPVSGS